MEKYLNLKEGDKVWYIPGDPNGESGFSDLPDTLEMRSILEKRTPIEAEVVTNWGSCTLQLKLIGLQGQIRSAVRPDVMVNNPNSPSTKISPDFHYKLMD